MKALSRSVSSPRFRRHTTTPRNASSMYSARDSSFSCSLPGDSKKGAPLPPTIYAEDIICEIEKDDLEKILGIKPSYPCYLDFSSERFNLKTSHFLSFCPDVIKEYVITKTKKKSKFY